MNIVQDLYLGWTDLDHQQDCPLPVWEPQLRIDQGRRGRLLAHDHDHGCPVEECDHANLFRRFTVRLVCRSCSAVHIITGQDVGISRTTTQVYGFGQPALETDGLWLWPGQQTLPGVDGEPREWVITRTPDRPCEPADVDGLICRYLSSGGHRRWQASAIADPTGPYGDDQLRWARRSSEHRSVSQAAAWIAAQYQPQTVEVAV
ncbi:hypothetical protein [Streptomyces anandii]|uniref:hypothetical protein n=1 Tax=Streptomyces anandii TaxID=285454 RepID=UPI0037AAC84B